MSAIKYSPMSEEELAPLPTLQEGAYIFHIIEAKFTTSANHNQMIMLKLGIIVDKKEHTVTDFLIFKPGCRMSFGHIHNFFAACNALDLYESGNIEGHEIVKMTGKCWLATKKGNKKPDGSFYEDRIGVKRYIPCKEEIEAINQKDVLDHQEAKALQAAHEHNEFDNFDTAATF